MSLNIRIFNNNDDWGSNSGDYFGEIGVPAYIEAYPESGYRFVNWTIQAGSGSFGSSTSENTTFTTTEDSEIVANFELIPSHTLTITDDGIGTTDPSGENSVLEGVPTSIIATPNVDIGEFKKWIVIAGSGVTFGDASSASTTVTLSSGDATIQATFKAVYQLPNVETISGLLKSYLFVDSSLPPLNIPLGDWLLEKKELVERIDVDPCVVDVENIQIDLLEDYSIYPEGFWYKIVNGYPTKDIQIMFTLMEGTDETFLFRGSVYRRNTNQAEFYVNGVDRVRGMSMQLVSLALASGEIATSDVTAELRTNRSLYDSCAPVNDYRETAYMYKLSALLKAIVKLTWSENVGNVDVVNNSFDLMASLNGSDWVQWTDLYFVGTLDTIAEPCLLYTSDAADE